MKDLLYLNKVINYKTKKDLMCDYFCWLYPFTNENINGYYNNLDFNDKTVLTVTSSGDHALNAIVNGAKEISSFDSNPLTKYYSELKVAGVKTLDLEEFLMFFYNKNLLRKQKYYLNKDIYEKKLRKVLDEKNKSFWDYVLNVHNYDSLYKSNLFCPDFLSVKGLVEANKYLKKESYILLKNKLNEIKIKYYDSNIYNLDKINNKFDLLILSNIVAFIDDDYVLQRLKNIFNKIISKNGVIVLNYYYSNLLYPKNQDLVYNFDELEKIFSEYDHKILTFESSDNLSTNKFYRSLGLKRDKVLILKK